MRLRDYQEKSKRTLNNNLVPNDQITNMLLGINGEMGEVTDLFKKYFYQGHELDMDLVSEELGDVMFYMVNLCNFLGLDMETVIENNHYKLLKRYPNGFSENRSVNRE